MKNSIEKNYESLLLIWYTMLFYFIGEFLGFTWIEKAIISVPGLAIGYLISHLTKKQNFKGKIIVLLLSFLVFVLTFLVLRQLYY